MVDKSFFILLIPCIAAICFAGYLAIEGIEGWGWFLFISICLFVYPKKTVSKSNDDKNEFIDG